MERSEKRFLISFSVLLAVLIVAVAVFAAQRRSAAASVYLPPEFDAGAVSGVLTVADEDAHYGHLELPISEGKCVVAAAATPLLENGELEVFLSSDMENTVYIRLVIFDENNTQVGASGILRPGEYIQSVTVSASVTPGSTLTAKLLTYEPDTYYSMGSASMTFNVR